MNRFAIVLGDPNSINIEILAKSNALKKNCIIIGSYNLLIAQLKKIKLKRKVIKINTMKNYKNIKNTLTVLDIPLKFKNPFNVAPESSIIYLKKSFNLAHSLSKSKSIKGFINCPINKKIFFKNKNIGVTEYLSSKNMIKQESAMLIYNEKLSVVPITTHIKVKDISKKLSKKIILNKVITINRFYKKYFKKRPKICLLGLNPHNYELRKNSEEKKLIIPCINILKNKMNISGPLAPDTVFIKDNIKNFDIIIGMYHDQVLTPFKALFGFDAANITLGLPYIRMSPDHGVGSDKRGLRISNPQSLNKCLKIISNIKING